MKVEITSEGVEIAGVFEGEHLRAVLEEGAKQHESLEDALLEILELGARVKDVVNTTATTQLLAKSVEEVQENLKALGEDHEIFLTNLMKEIVSEDSNSDINLVTKLAEWRKNFDKKLEDDFNAQLSGSIPVKIRSAIDEYLKTRESAIARLLSLDSDPDAAESRPLKQVYDQVSAILERLNFEEGKKKASRSSSKKGTSFETAVYSIVEGIADEFGDLADDCGAQAKPGVDGNNEGDITVDFLFNSLAGVSGRLVIECKHHNGRTAKKSLLQELNAGFSNREGDYGILVTNESGYDLKGEFPYWEDWDSRRGLLVLEDDHTKIDSDKIRFAYLLAKARIRDMKSDIDADTLEKVQERISTITESFKRISQLRGNHTKIGEALNDMNNDINFLNLNVGDELKKLNSLLTSAQEEKTD